MQVICKVCGASSNVTKAQKDFKRFAAHPELTYICEKCNLRIQLELQGRSDVFKNLTRRDPPRLKGQPGSGGAH